MQSARCTTISNSFLTAAINHKGAELVSLQNSNHKEYIWDANPEFWSKHSPVLFPIVGTLKNNSYTLNNRVYHLPRHGFARDMEFTLIEKQDDSARFSLKYTDETLLNFPFKFELRIIYRLIENVLDIQYEVFNNGESEMPFSIGAHPAFALARDFGNYHLEFEEVETLQYHLLENDLISENTDNLKLHDNGLPLDYSLFKNDALIFKSIQSKSITIFECSKPRLKMSFKDFPDLGLWTKENAPFLCIEPWFGYSDTATANGNLFEKEGILVLHAATNFTAKFTIEIF